MLPWQAKKIPLTQEQENLKQNLYQSLKPRRRKFIDRIGYETWDPFQLPNDPLDLREDASKRTTQQLVREFMRDWQNKHPDNFSNDFGKGVLDCALGIINKDERYLGIFAFCSWYEQLLKREGINNEG